MQIDAEMLQTLLIAAFGATAAIYGDRGIRKWRNGGTFEDEAKRRPGHAKQCRDHIQRMAKIEARIAVLEQTDDD